MSRDPKIEVVTFDVGGTLMVPYPSVGEIYADVMARHEIEADAEMLDEAFSRTIREAMETGPRQKTSSDREWWREVVRRTMDHLGEPDNFDAMFDDLWEEFAHPDRWRLLDGARETLTTLRERGYRMGLLSNWDNRLRPLLERLELDELFEVLTISCEVGVEKPDQAIFAVAQQAFLVEPEALLHIGDSLRHDIEGARSMGWQAVLIDPQGKHPEVEPRVETLPALLELLP